MNVGRGLFRAWIVISILWIAGAGIVAYVIVSPDTVQGSFQPAAQIKKEAMPGTSEEIDWTKPFYDLVVSPASAKLHVTFFPVEWQHRDEWKNKSHILVNFPDGSVLYILKGYNEADKNYITGQFWEQRWGRYAYTTGIVALWAFVPCVLFFVLGYALLWVGRGFRRA